MTSVAEFLASVNPNDLVLRVGPLALYRLELADGSKVLAGVTDATASPEVKAATARGTTALHSLGLEHGFLQIAGVDPAGRGFLAKPVPTGCARDLKVLSWPLTRRLQFFRGVVESLIQLHSKSIAHGTITPEHVMLGENLMPLLLGPGVAEIRDGVYAAPEVRAGAPGGVRSDIYSLGRLLEFFVREEDPEPETGVMLLLPKMAKAPAGLTRIVRKCTVQDPERRYATAQAVLTDLGKYSDYAAVGLEHPDAVEENRTGSSLSELPPAGGVVNSKSPIHSKQPHGSRQSTARVTGAGHTAKAEPVLSPQERAVRKALRQKQILAGTIVVGVLVALFFAVPAIRLAIVRGNLDSPDPAEKKEAIRAVMGLDRNLRGYNFRGVDFRDLTVVNANFAGADLSGADFRESDLSYVNLRHARLNGAKFEGANLRSARVFEAEGLEEAQCDRTTAMPGGWKCTDDRFVAVALPSTKKGLRGPK
jgi:hypothetical protein